MGKKFKSMGELKHYIENMVNIALDTTVKDGTVQALENYASDVVYGGYSPILYNRRHSLEQDGSYDVNKSDNMKIKITPIARFNPSTLRYDSRTHSYVPSISRNGYGDELAGLINYGDGWGGYNYEFVLEDAEYLAPRPFIDYTREDLGNGGYKELLAAGLEDLGLPVK